MDDKKIMVGGIRTLTEAEVIEFSKGYQGLGVAIPASWPISHAVTATALPDVVSVSGSNTSILNATPLTNSLGIESANQRQLDLSAELDAVTAERDALYAKVTALTNAINHMPLVARWHHGNGVLVCGTVRVAREDFDTDPSEKFRTSFWNNVCNVMNAAAHFRNADLSEQLGLPPEPMVEWNPTNTQRALIMGVTGTPEQQNEARQYFSHYQDRSLDWFRKLIKEG